METLYGGGVSLYWTNKEIQCFTKQNLNSGNSKYKFIRYSVSLNITGSNIIAAVPFQNLINKLSRKDLQLVVNKHNIYIPYFKTSKALVISLLKEHKCNDCPIFYSIFEPLIKDKTSKFKKNELKEKQTYHDLNNIEMNTDGGYKFPPSPLLSEKIESVIEQFCNKSNKENIMEFGCAVCGQLVLNTNLKKINSLDFDWTQFDITQYSENYSFFQKINVKSFLAPNCDSVCISCIKYLNKNQIPPLALKNNYWLGEVPIELNELNWTEKLLISRVIHNYCIVKVASSGSHKLRANAICHSVPMPKIYNVLPPKKRN